MCSVQAQNMRKIVGCCIKDSLNSIQTETNGLASLALHEIRHKVKNSFLNNYYGIDPANAEAEIGGMLKMRPLAHTGAVASLCTQFSAVANGLYTFQVRLGNFGKLVNLLEIEHLSLARKAEPQLNNARHDAGVDMVHSGLNLPMPYTGKGVLAGLVDIGIDYTHPAFKNGAGDSLRIVKAWAQNLTSGTRPTDFKYGVELEGEKAILAVAHDSAKSMHGTIVLGSLASGGYGSDGKYKGVAPESKIIAVTSRQYDNSILDGASYFFKEAKKLKKRGVFNISWGSHIGPHDGTSLFDQTLDSIIAAGNVVIGAAGNWAAAKIHIKHATTTDTGTTSSLILQGNVSDYIIVDLWGKPNTSFQVQLKAVDKVTGAVSYASRRFSTSTQRENAFFTVFGKDTTIMYVINKTKNAYNNRPNSLVAVLHDHVSTGKNISLSITTGTQNEVHAWMGQNGWFWDITEKEFKMPNYIRSDNMYTVGELGGSSKSIITVGAHVPHRPYKNLLGEDIATRGDSGQICPFSSVGPMLDGRIKPDLTAPGSMALPCNSFYYDPNGEDGTRTVLGSPFEQGGRTYNWFNVDATSYAAPFVAGSVALLLQAEPTLNQKQIKDLLQRNTTIDQFTGSIPTNGSNTWGFGKLNVYKAMSSLLNIPTSVDAKASVNGVFWSSNPVSGSITIFTKLETDKTITLKVVDMLGSSVVPNGLPLISREGSFYSFDTSVLKNGQYIGILSSGQETLKTFKITKVD